MAKSWKQWLTEKKLDICVSIASVLATLFVGILAIVYSDLRLWFLPRVIPCGELIASKNFIGVLRNATYIAQPVLEKELDLFVARSGNEYIVVNGPKGAGKSTLINQVISKQPFGMLSLSLQSSDVDVYTIIANDICGQKGVWKINDVAHVFQESFEIVRKQTGQMDWVPTLAIEVDRASSDASVHQIARDVKLLCVDKGMCRGIVVLSDALAAFALPKDPRVKMLWVDDFTVNQANQYLDSLGYLTLGSTSANSTMREKIFDELGTRPIDLIRLIGETRHDVSLIEPYMAQRREECDTELKALFASRESPSGQEFKHLAREILNSSTLSVKASSLPDNTMFPIVKRVAIVLKEHHAMMYHPPTKSYVFASKCIANAAMEWLKNEKSN